MTAITLMAERQEKLVMLQVEVPESIRARLKMEAIRQGTTMGELAQKILNEALPNFESKDT
ncbi:hypothetical protein [Aliterella atlantica]|uniref:CopG-like ribbon-helix-helix domain-containing protein n=1 Tax=Aliterella atlantica CENA595 TaxID=1618023 RepID=A0A0D8ZLC4_9CYAN|nr:hypothetical protein [Aliterella atlantica]KJH69540.1 hypothetical protein UH38_23315 [Aliterella atlantica CENA595]